MHYHSSLQHTISYHYFTFLADTTFPTHYTALTESDTSWRLTAQCSMLALTLLTLHCNCSAKFLGWWTTILWSRWANILSVTSLLLQISSTVPISLRSKIVKGHAKLFFNTVIMLFCQKHSNEHNLLDQMPNFSLQRLKLAWILYFHWYST